MSPSCRGSARLGTATLLPRCPLAAQALPGAGNEEEEERSSGAFLPARICAQQPGGFSASAFCVLRHCALEWGWGKIIGTV